VITNERQYRITRAQLKRFDLAAKTQGVRDPSPGVDPRIHAAMGEPCAAKLKSSAASDTNTNSCAPARSRHGTSAR
jgi:hypothetical protein